MSRRSRHSRSVTFVLMLTGSILLGGAMVVARSPGTSGSPAAPCQPLSTLAPPPSPTAEDLPNLTVFAAASLTKPFTVMGQAWAAQHAGSTLTFSFDASSALRTQIEHGAPADVFASADLENPQALIDGCLASAPVIPFAANHLVIVVPTENPAGVDSWDDLAAPGVRIVAAGDDVPITKYAEQVITNLATQPGAPAVYADAIHGNIVSREDNVSAVLAKIALGEGDAGIVYVSDATSEEGVAAIAIPAEANVLATYGAVEVATTTVPDGVSAFLTYLNGPEAQAILAQFGFLPSP